jgi:hypothetical protein
VAEQIIGWLNVEASRVSKTAGYNLFSRTIVYSLSEIIFSCRSVAPSQVSVLLSWICALYSLLLSLNHLFMGTPAWQKLVTAFALVLDTLLDPGCPAKPSVRKQSIVQARRAVRSVCHLFICNIIDISPIS